MSEFPSGWATKTIEETCDIHDSRRIPLSSEQRRDRKGRYPYYGANNIQDYIDDFIFDFDAVLLAEDGGYYEEYESRDIAQYATNKYWVNNHAHILTGKSGMDTKFLYYSLVRKNICQWINTGTRSKLNQADLKQIELLVPPLPEQKKIAAILSGIDNLTQAVRERIYRLQIVLDGLANSWETQLSIRGEEGMLGDLIDSIDSGWSPACEEFPPKSGEWGVLKVSAVTRGEFYEAESKRLPPDLPPREQFIVKKDDLLITRANGNLDLVGRGVIVSKEPDAKLLMSDKILRLNPRSNCDRNFLLLALNSRSVRQQIEIGVGGSTGAKNIGQGFLRQIAIAIPSSSDQIRIGNLSRSLSAALVSTKRKFEHLVSLKKGLSSDLLSGRKRVSV
jgi:type I restriction enzyme S subunit